MLIDSYAIIKAIPAFPISSGKILSPMHIIIGLRRACAKFISLLQFEESKYFCVIKHTIFAELRIPFPSKNSKNILFIDLN